MGDGEGALPAFAVVDRTPSPLAVLPAKVDSLTVIVPLPPLPLSIAPPSVAEVLSEKVLPLIAPIVPPVAFSPLWIAPPPCDLLPENVVSVMDVIVPVPPKPFAIAPPTPAPAGRAVAMLSVKTELAIELIVPFPPPSALSIRRPLAG